MIEEARLLVGRSDKVLVWFNLSFWFLNFSALVALEDLDCLDDAPVLGRKVWFGLNVDEDVCAVSGRNPPIPGGNV